MTWDLQKVPIREALGGFTFPWGLSLRSQRHEMFYKARTT